MANEIHADSASGGTLYAVIRNSAGQTWRTAGQVFEDWGTDGHAAADYAISLTDKSGSRHVGDFDPNIPAGDYSIQVFVQAGGAPADTDTLVGGQEFVWTGDGELTAIKILVNKTVQNKVTKKMDYYDNDGQTILLAHVLTEDASTVTRTPE
jgi:hypothetical protein